jgi:hypothetical protein
MKAPLASAPLLIEPRPSTLRLWERHSDCVPANCARWISTAEKELAAFMVSVERLFGEAASRRAGEYWVENLAELRVSKTNTCPDWRFLTIAAAKRLASEMTTDLAQINQENAEREVVRSDQVSNHDPGITPLKEIL